MPPRRPARRAADRPWSVVRGWAPADPGLFLGRRAGEARGNPRQFVEIPAAGCESGPCPVLAGGPSMNWEQPRESNAHTAL